MMLSLRLLWRDFKAGELWLILVSLIIAVATVTAISIFADRIRNSIQDQASQLLAGDIQIRGSSKAPDEWRQKAEELGLQQADILTFQAMIFSETDMTLASVKAVSNTYPLKGRLGVGLEPFVEDRKVDQGPKPGEAWLASRLFGAMKVGIGDSISIGESEFKVTSAIIAEPDSSQSFFGVGPRVFINDADIDATGVLQLGSRMSFRWLLAGTEKQLEEIVAWLEPKLGMHHRIVGVEKSDRGVGSALDRAESFLLLAGSLGVILAGASLALSARRYSQRKETQVALLKTFGMTPSKIFSHYLVNLSIIAVTGTAIGLFVGWVVHELILTIFSGILPENLMPFGSKPIITGIITGLISLFAFAAPPIFSLRQTPPSKVIRSDLSSTGLGMFKTVAIGFVSITALVYWYSESVMITAALLGGLLFALVVVSFLALILIFLLRKVGVRLGRTWKIGLANLHRHSKQNSLQVMIFSVSLMLLFVITMVRGALIDEWQNQMPEDIPNHFVYNIFENELPAVKDFIETNKLVSSEFYPMVRGRFIGINGVNIRERLELLAQTSGDDYRRELNLTWSSNLASDNEIIKGEWWQPGDDQKALVSVESSFAEGLGLSIGDELEFSIAGQQAFATVASIRTVQWDSLKPNFYVIFSGKILGGRAASYMTSFRLETEQKPLLTGFARSLPTVSLIEIEAVIAQIRGIISQVTLAVEFILLFVLLSGLLVLATSIQATLDDRIKESVILRTLGAQKSLVLGSLFIEFGALGWLSGLMGAAGAEAVLYMLQSEVFSMEFTWHPILWIAGPWIGLILISSAGLLSTKGVVRIPPLAILRSM